MPVNTSSVLKHVFARRVSGESGDPEFARQRQYGCLTGPDPLAADFDIAAVVQTVVECATAHAVSSLEHDDGFMDGPDAPRRHQPS
ncbi:hypothetical protein GCM10009619_41900 [Williamsia maris]